MKENRMTEQMPIFNAKPQIAYQVLCHIDLHTTREDVDSKTAADMPCGGVPIARLQTCCCCSEAPLVVSSDSCGARQKAVSSNFMGQTQQAPSTARNLEQGIKDEFVVLSVCVCEAALCLKKQWSEKCSISAWSAHTKRYGSVLMFDTLWVDSVRE